MFDFGMPPIELVARTAIVYVGFVLVLRVFGKRELGQFTIFDLAMLMSVATCPQPGGRRQGTEGEHELDDRKRA